MSCSSFRSETKININGRAYLLKNKINGHIWQVQDCKDLSLKGFSETELQGLYVKGALSFEDGLVSSINLDRAKGIANQQFSAEKWDLLKVKRMYVVSVLNLPATEAPMKEVIQNVWEKIKKPERPPNWVTVLRWKARYLASGSDIRSLGLGEKKRGNRSPRYPEEVIRFVTDGVDKFYMTREQKNVEDVVDLVRGQISRENDLRPNEMKLPLPKTRLVRRIINEIPAFDRCMAREGRNAALKKFRGTNAHRITQAPLDRAEIDHTLLDLMLTDETGFPLGRPWVTACIDDYSRCVLGIVVGFEPPSFHTVAQCLKAAFLPKVFLRRDYPNIDNEWLAHGVMRELVVDNGVEFHSESLDNACLCLGIEIHYSARKTPWFKGKIERFLGTLNKEVAHGNPGTTFSNIIDKDDYDPVKHAVIRYSVFQNIMRKWIADVYHQRPHSTLHATPASVWINSIDPSDVALPDNIAQLDAILGRTENRVLTHKGIELNGLFYNSSEMTALRRRLSDKLKVDIRVDDSDLGSIIVISPDSNQIFNVPALLKSYAQGLTSYQHKICKKYAQTYFGKNNDLGYLEAKLAIAEIIAQEANSGRKKARAKVARYSDVAHDPEVLDIGPAIVDVAEEASSSASSSYEACTEQKRKFSPILRVRDPSLIHAENNEENGNE